MKELPIIFSTPMVEAIIVGRKTMTRRIVNEINEDEGTDFWEFLRMQKYEDGSLRAIFDDGDSPGSIKCPYGNVGDFLWVREAHSLLGLKKGQVAYRAGQEDPKAFRGWKPSIHMKKEYARIWLRVESVRVERLNLITEADAKKEGVRRHGNGWKDYTIIHAGRYKGQSHPFTTVPMRTTIFSFLSLWESINGDKSWDQNPWVWVIRFSVLSTSGRP